MPSMRKQQEIAERARAIGWNVEEGGGPGSRGGWLYRITRPDGLPVLIHGTPSDHNWYKIVLTRLNGPKHLFDEAEARLAAKKRGWRKTKLAEDQAANAKAIADAAERAQQQEAAVTRAAGPRAVVEFDPAWLLTPHEFPEYRRGILTPELAGKLLSTIDRSRENRHQRSYRRMREQFFADQIEAGDFAATHQGMAIDSNGKFQDGQHRAGAIQTTGQAQTVWVCVGAPPEHFTKLDDPLKRTANDAATIRGEVNVTNLTSSARLILGFDRLGGNLYNGQKQFRLTPTVVDRFIEGEGGDELRDAVAKCIEIRKEIKVVASALAASIYLIRRTVGRDHHLVARFFEDLELGVRDKSDVVHMLRRYIMNSSGKERGTTYVTFALIIKAWNARAVGKRPSALSWRSDERFPATIIVPAPEDDA